jgi:hypothetical protein
MCYGSPDAPIANILLDRDGGVWVCAAGATNTNGKGGPVGFSKGNVPKDSMNTYAIGIEAANNGLGEPWPQVQIDAYFTLNNLLASHLGLNPDDCCTHQAYAPDRKIDPATASAVKGPWRPGSVTSSGTWSLADISREANERAAGNRPPDPPEDDNMELVEVEVLEANARFLAYKITQDGIALIPWMEWVNGSDPLQLARLQAYRELNIPVHKLVLANLPGVTLIGPLPTGDTKHSWKRSDFGNVIT